MPLLALTKGQKKAAKRAAKRQGAPATRKVSSSNVEYTIVGTIEPERLDTPAVRITPTQDSAMSTRADAIFIPEHSSPVSSGTIVTARPTSNISQELSPPNTVMPGPQSSGPSPTLSSLPLESLDSFNDSFSFTASTRVVTFGERSNITDVSCHECASSSSKDVEGVKDKSPASVRFCEAFVGDLRSPRFTTATASSKAFEEALSRTSDPSESSIFTRLKDATTTNASVLVHEENFPCTAVGFEEKPEVSLDYANQERALVPYCRLKSLSLTMDYGVERIFDENGTGLTLESILRGRMFLASADGVVQCIAYDQLLHDVETIKDDGGSDFDSVASPNKSYHHDLGDAHDENFESIGSRIENVQSGFGIDDRRRDVKEGADLDGLEVSASCLQPANKDGLDREDLSSCADVSDFGSEEAASVSTEKGEGVATQQGRLQPTTSSDTKEKIHGALQNAATSEESAEAVSTNSQVPGASDCASELNRIRLGTEPLSSYLEVVEAEESGSATRNAVVTAFLKLVNIERKKRGVHALPSLYTAQSVLRSSVLPHTIKLGTTTIASFIAPLSFDEKDEVEMGDVCAAWDRLGHEEVQQ